MHELITYSSGFSTGVEWPWPISVYLLLAGISGGSLIVAFFIKYYLKQTEVTAVYKSAALVSFVTIMLGMICLVADLTRPILFWKILITYNWTSVMSIGVAALMLYIPLSAVVFVYAFEKELKKFLPFLNKFEWLFKLLNKVKTPVEGTLFFFAVVVCAYTGFLISVLVRFPILNTSILPALFVVSGLSAGTAALCIVARKYFNEDVHSKDMAILHKIEWPIMATEVMFLIMLFVSLLIGDASSKAALGAFHEGIWSTVFWIGIVGVGFVTPVILNFALGKKIAHSAFTFYTSALCSIFAVLCLRLFIVYAGQIFSV